MYIKRPGKVRKSYALIGDDGGTVKDPRIDQINEDLRAGVPRDVLEARMKALLRSFKPIEDAPLLLAANEHLVERRHRDKLLKKPDLARPEELRKKLLSAVGMLGPLPLESASDSEIYAVTSKIKQPERRFEVLRGINELLKYLGRPTLYNPPIQRSSRVAFIEVEAFKRKAIELPHETQIVLGALLATGCRWGELPLAENNNMGVPCIHIEEQITAEGITRRTKNKKARDVVILKSMISYWERYSALPAATKKDIRLNKYNSTYLKCKKVLGIRIHDLRHSYAVALRKAGISVLRIAEMIGDTEDVCRKRYLRHGLTEDEITDIWKKLS